MEITGYGSDKAETDISKWWGRLHVEDFFDTTQPVIYWFNGEYRFLSNFHVVSPLLTWKNKLWFSTEHIYQAEKARDNEEGETWREKIRLEPSPGKAKKYGKQITIREDWESIKLGIMKKIVLLKFQNHDLKQKLLATGNAYLVEGTTWHDSEWGICINKECDRGCDKKAGMNHLGRILMEVRQELRDL